MSSNEQVIAVMGPTGVGKSSFILNAVPPGLRTEIKVGHGIQSETNGVQPVSWNTEGGTRITLVDTPGFDDSRAAMTDVKVLKMIATFLTKDYKRGQKSRLSGLVYIHRISDVRIGRTSQLNLRMFQKLCGPDSLKNVVIVTTMWDMVSLEEGSEREQELKLSDSMFKPVLDGGATIMRHHNTPQSATEVINRLLGKTATTVQIVREMAEEKKHLQDTEAGIELQTDIEGILKKHKEEMESVNADIWEAMQCEIAEERERSNQVINGLLEQLEELRRTITMTTESDSDSSSHYEPTSNFPTPETKSVVHYAKLLQLIKTSESTITSAHPELSHLVSSRAIQFANAMEESVECVQRGLVSLRSALSSSSESVHDLRQFTNSDQHPRAFTYGMWVKARDDMQMLTNNIRSILSQYPNLSGFFDRIWNRKAAKRSDALNTILKCTREVVADMNIMVYWWKPVIDALGNVEDASYHLRGTDFDDSAVKLTLPRIIRALDSYYEAFKNCPQQIHKAASGMPLTT